MQGTVVDESRGVLPGATVTATEISTGRQSIAVTLGGRPLPPREPAARPVQAAHRAARASRPPRSPNIELLVGANATVPPIAMKVASLEETVTVSGETPLVDVRSSQVAGNIDRRQMAELPLQGRNWQELSLMVKGITANNVSNTPGAIDDQFQLNLDGQQITQRVAGSGFGQPKVSREAIAEFQIVTNMFDITQGRSTGMQVQAISRSGTNDMRASAYGFFRDDTLNAPDPVANKVLPFQNQQVGGTLGGPIVRDKAHFFGSYRIRAPAAGRLPGADAPAESDLRVRDQGRQQELPGARRHAGSSRDNSLTVRGQRWEFEQPVLDLERHGAPVHGRQPASRTPPTSPAPGRTSISSNLMMQVQGGSTASPGTTTRMPSKDVQFHQHAVLRAAVQHSRA